MTELVRIEEPEPLLLTVNDYRVLADAGAFAGRSKVELIEGVILTVSPQRKWHWAVKSELARRIGNKLEELGLPLRAGAEGTVKLSENSAPEPDIVIASLSGDWDAYLGGGEVKLMIEIADTSEKFDLGKKRLLYARHGIPEYWVLTRQLIYCFWGPAENDYRHQDKRAFGQPIASATISDLTVETAGIL